VQIGWNPLPEGVESVKVALSAVLTDSTVDWGKRGLDEIYEACGPEPAKGLAEGACKVLVRSVVQPVTFRKVGEIEHFRDGPDTPVSGKEEDFKVSPPNGSFIRRFSEPDRALRIDRLFSTAERIRNYLAYASALALPVVGILVSRDFLYPVRMESSPSQYMPNVGVPFSTERTQEWYKVFEEAYARTQLLLDTLSPSEPSGRAVSLVGESIWTADVEERFFYAWRALEVIASSDLSRARGELSAGNPKPLEPYLERASAALSQGHEFRIDPQVRVEVSVTSRLSAGDAKIVPKLYELRNAIAHGEVTPAQHLEVLNLNLPIVRLARTIAETTLKVQPGSSG